jgi:spore coat polysaccharide biosynthesis predicted glycosyltransferase SpsG
MFTFGRPVTRVVVICRGSEKHGLGHVIRSRTVAGELATRSRVKLIAIGDIHAELLLNGQAFPSIVVREDGDVEKELVTFAPDIVVFDLLEFESSLLGSILGTKFTVSLSPIFSAILKVDMVFHRTRYLDEGLSPASFQGSLRCGLDYAIVRRQCVRIESREYESNASREPLAVAISMGGGDASNKTLRLLTALRDVEVPLLLWVLLGEAYTHSYDALVDCVKRDSRHEIILAKTGDSMWRIMRQCAVAILAGGTVTYEAAFAGLPSINTFEERGHLFLARELVERGVCLNAGYPFDDAVDVAIAQLRHLEANRSQLVEMHHRCQGLLRGDAAASIADEIIDGFWEKCGQRHPTVEQSL